ncbi:hypothetical protein GWI33_004143 [Rhynchophorus ferrugineus]|uniref:Uncharacterized protein n=1 Tax=Rhynchophorus ferrugineus TaxID=354439 RepID=A0A834LXM6_RHYFE|nr:hypothetical protein GWI33_004143 [Rhynchophorus ferrugineus]
MDSGKNTKARALIPSDPNSIRIVGSLSSVFRAVWCIRDRFDRVHFFLLNISRNTIQPGAMTTTVGVSYFVLVVCFCVIAAKNVDSRFKRHDSGLGTCDEMFFQSRNITISSDQAQKGI